MKKSTLATFHLQVLFVLLMAIVAGCKMKEFSSTPFYSGDEVKFTGNVEDRVNLWPLAYWREPVGSVAWPLVSFGNDHFALRPIYSQYKAHGKSDYNEFNFLWPLCQADTQDNDYHVFPFFWGWDVKDRGYQALFPIYWNGPCYNSLFPLWIYRNSHGKKHLSILSGSAGYSSKTNGFEANWCFPLWYWNNRKTFVTTMYGQWDNGWVIPPLFSWGESETNGDYRARYLLGLGGVTKNKGDVNHWAFPIYNRSELLCCDSNRHCRTRLLLNLTGWENKNDKLLSSYVFPLYSWHTDESFLSPLFYWNRDGSLLTPLGGRTINQGTTNIYVTPLAGWRYGKKNGHWLVPIWNHEKYEDFDAYAAIQDSCELSSKVKLWTKPVTNMTWNADKTAKDVPVVSSQRRGSYFSKSDDTHLLVALGFSDDTSGYMDYALSPTNNYVITRRKKRGNPFVFNYSCRRSTGFNFETRQKTSDKETAETALLLLLYNHERKTNLLTKDEYDLHSVLWRLWHREEENGNVALDVFPGFTYDSKTNGYSKTSFLWRFFRYENDPEKGTSADFLFIPIMRP